MKKTWSISTTVRNPERLRGFLRVLKTLEGQPFNKKNQIRYQTLLIKERLYHPGDLTKEQESYFEDDEKEMPLDVAEIVFAAQNYKDPAMRGRQSVNPLNKMGLAIAKDSSGPIVITDFGEYFLSDNYDLGRVFFIDFLKWQLPNPDSRSFSSEDGFCIKPFIGVLHLIKEVNKKWQSQGNKPVGITKEEFALFAITLIDYKDIEKHATEVIKFRNAAKKYKGEELRKYKNLYAQELAEAFLNTKKSEEIVDFLDNIWDYADNAIRYFRLTRYIYIRGGGFYIDLEPRRQVETERLLATDSAAPIIFKDLKSYLSYIADINQPILPWQTETELKNIIVAILEDIARYQTELKEKKISILNPTVQEVEKLTTQELSDYIEYLRGYRRSLQDLEIRYKSQEIGSLEDYIFQLGDIYNSDAKKSIELERLATLALNALNDAIKIKPNYPVGDDNEPTFTAPGNKADIECFYEGFNSICEVTMLTDRSQWYNEGQPVMRHLRDFESKNLGSEAYCLFVAPKIHQDTIETFWMSIKHGYKGSKQYIVPLSIKGLISLLEILLKLKKQGKQFKHSELLSLYKEILESANEVQNSDQWLGAIPAVLEKWGSNLFLTK